MAQRYSNFETFEVSEYLRCDVWFWAKA